MPTGVAIRDVREQLFDAAERILLRDGPNALTSRAVTTEANVAKGVLHRHFTDFDEFLKDLVLDRIQRLDGQTADLMREAGQADLIAILADALTTLFSSVAVGLVALIIARDELRTRLRQALPTGGVPLLGKATEMIAGYLGEERRLGRITADADPDMLAHTLIGAGHLLFADRETGPPQPEAVRKMVATVVAGASPSPGDQAPRTA